MVVKKVVFLKVFGWEHNDSLDWLLRNELHPTDMRDRHGRIYYDVVAKNEEFNPFLHLEEPGISFEYDSKPFKDPIINVFRDERERLNCCHCNIC